MRLPFVSMMLVAAGATGLAISLVGPAGAQSHFLSHAEQLAKIKATATPAGDPVDCITTAALGAPRVLDDDTIDFRMRGGKVYRNSLPRSCPQLGSQESFTYGHASNLCNGELIQVSAPGGNGGASCALGKFQPVDYPKTGG